MNSYLSSVSITYPAQKNPSDLKIALDKENITLNQGKTYTLTLDTDYHTSSTGALTFVSSIPSVAEVDENGVITAKSYGKTIVTLSQASDSHYAAGSVSFTVKVIAPEGQTEKPQVTITDDGTVTLTGEAGSNIYYTTDGSTPTASSTEYSNPISAQGQVVKAIAICGSKSPSDIVTAYANVEGTFKWNWNTSGTLQTKPVVEGNVQDVIDENTKAVIGKKLKQGFYDKSTVKAVSVEPVDKASVVYAHDEESAISFNIIPVAGVAFQPTAISFKAASITSSGLMDVYLNSESQSYTLLESVFAKREEMETFGNDRFKTQLSAVEGTDEEWTLKTYIYTLTYQKQWAFSDIIVTGKFKGVEYDGVFFNISVAAEPADGGVVTHIPSAQKVPAGKKVTFKASPKEGYKFVKWTDVDSDAEVTAKEAVIQSVNSDVSYVATFAKLPLISFENTVSELVGTVPEAAYVGEDGSFKIPENTTLYKEGYALTAWTDGTNIYDVGVTYNFSADVTLRPVMTKCEKALADTDAAITVRWNFDQKDGAPVISGTFTDVKDAFIYTKGVSIGESKRDLQMKIYGNKADNNDARVNYLTDRAGNEARGGQLNNGATLNIPAVYGMTIKMQASAKADYGEDAKTPNETFFANVPDEGNLATLSFDGTTATADNATLAERTLTYIYKGDASTIEIKVENAGSINGYGYFNWLEVTYPVLPDVLLEKTITNGTKITDWEKADNAGSVEKSAPAAGSNTGNRYKAGDKVTVTAEAAYGYYISAFKAGGDVLTMTKVLPDAESAQPTKATAEYTVGETIGTVTVEYTRLPMGMVRLETVDKKLGMVDFVEADIHENFYEKGEDYVQSWFVAESTVHGTTDAADDYVLQKWVKTDDGSVTEAQSPDITVPAEGATVTYQAYFTPGKTGNVVFLHQPKVTADGGTTLVDLEIDAASNWPENQTNCRSFYIPKYHGLFKTYDADNNENGWTLKYWIDENKNRYEIGKNYSFATENQTISLTPVFEENPAGMQNRINEPVLAYEFGTGIGIRAQKLNIPKNTLTYLCAPVYTEVLKGGNKIGHTRDVPLRFKTGAKGFVRNTDFQEWAAIGPGTELIVASCAGTKIELLSYAPITSTTIDGVVPTEYEKIGEHEYVYRYTTQNPASHISVVIGDDYGYYKWIKAHTPSSNRVQLHATVANAEQGEVTGAGYIIAEEAEDREYMQKLEDGGYSFIHSTRVKLSFERKFAYTFDKIVDADNIVDGEPAAVLQLNDDGTVTMVKADGSFETLAKNENGEWGTKDNIFVFRETEPTAEEKREGKRTRYEVEFDITDHRNLVFHFKEKPTYYITFNAGKLATGIAPTAKWVEEGDEYVIPSNSTLYYSGYTLKRWKSEDGNTTYDIGKTYQAPGDNLRLFPEFDVNNFSLLDNNLTKESTATWQLARNAGAPDLAYERTSGILVTQLKKDPDDENSDFIDLRIDLNASTREIGENESKTTVYGKFNNMNYDDRCQINMYSILSFPVTKGCEIELAATGTISTTNIAGATSANGGYTAGKTVKTTWDGMEGTQDVNFQSDGRYYTYFAVTYKPQTIEKPALQSVTISGTPLTAAQLEELKQNGSVTVDAYPVKLDPATGKFVEEKMDEVLATASGTGKTEIEQPSLDNPTAVIRLLTSGNIRLNTYTVKFDLKPTESQIAGAETTPQFLYTEINGTKYTETNVTVENMPASGYIKVVFDRTMQSVSLPFTDKENNLDEAFTAEQGKELIFYYWNIPNAELNYTLPGSMFKDIYGKEFAGSFEKHFKTRSTTKELYQKTFDFIVGKDGSLDDAIKAANDADTSTGRFLIFVPDGEYQLTGFESLEGRYNITSDGAWPCDEDGNAVTDTEMASKHNYQNGMTLVSRPNVSIIGQSREGVKIFNRPVVEGISYTATIHLGKEATDFYAEDITLENRFNYWSTMNGGSGAGRAVAFWDQGQRSVMKNVSLMSWQDTYFSNNAALDYRGYFEGCTIAGVVDWLCGDGNIWFEKCDIVIRDRSGNNIAAPSQDDIQQWGYVFNECNIVPEFPLSQMEKLKDRTWTLARPWANSPTKSPACTFIKNKMSVLPKDQGWGAMGGGAVLRFHENRSMDSGGTLLSLGARSLAACAPAAGSDDCVMNDAEAEKYTMQNVLGGTDSFTPMERTLQIDALSGGEADAVNSEQWNDNIETDDDRLQWQPHPKALCYFVFKLENGQWMYKANTTETFINLEQLSLGTGTYCVRAANQYGGLGAPTAAITYQEVKRYTLTLKQLGDLTVDGVPYGWSTICLPYNAKTPEGVTVYAATASDNLSATEKIDDYYMTLTPVSILSKEKGYVVYGPAGEYVFKGTSRSEDTPTILVGNATDTPVSAVNINCYVLANKTYGLGFYKYTGSTLSPYRAWLPADMVVTDVNTGLSSGTKGIRFVFGEGDTPTGLCDHIRADITTEGSRLYNLSGQPVTTPQRQGIYIQGGKGKVAIRRK